MPKKTAKKKPKPFFKERRAFIQRMLGGGKSDNFALDMKAATDIFEKYKNDIDFLSKVKPPFKFEGSLKWLITNDGFKYLESKYKEFYYKPKSIDLLIDLGEKVGEDLIIE